MRIATALLLITAATSLAESKPKNVIFLIADDLGRHLGCYGDHVAKTPNVDAYAARGTKFTRAFASVASCSPSRSTMLTGLPTHQSGQYGLAHADHNASTFKKVKSLPAILNAAGYRTGVLAKLHVQPKEVYPFTEEIPAGGGRNGESIAVAARKFITESKAEKKPFFLHVGYTDPHRDAKGFGNSVKLPESTPKTVFDPKTVPVPYHLPDTPEVRGDLAEYYQSVARFDYNIGLMRKVLDETGVADDTIVFIFSDNGIPFAGAKTNLYDAGVHLPLIIYKPGQKAGCENDSLVSWTDLAPSVLDAAGLSQPDVMLGHSLLPHLEAVPMTGFDTVFGSHQYHEITMYYPMRMVRTQKYKLILNLAHGLEYPHAGDLWASPTWQSILTSKASMMGARSVKQYLNRPREELYDLSKDAHELVNRIDDGAYSHVKDELRAKLAAWRKKTQDPWLIKDKHE
jgi:N-sulfoglucosamine sulfohydrolase